jgi:hypothetical protein
VTICDLYDAFRLVFLPVVGFIALGCTLVWGFSRFAAGLTVQGQAALIAAFGAVGGVLGFAGGNSREPVVGTLLSALLTFLAGLLTYLFSREELSQWRPVIPYCIIVLLLNALFGLSAGSTYRGKFDDYQEELKKRLLRYERVELEVEKARQLRDITLQAQTPVADAGVKPAP